MFRLLFVPALIAATHTLAAAESGPLPPIEIPDSLEATRAVDPGLVRYPMMATLDDRGRLFVAENAGVNLDRDELLEQRPSLIRLLEDENRDGVYDKATVFADGLTFPQGALWVYDSLYVMSPPSLWRFEDRDGDGRAEIREELATGFDFTGNAADVHGPFLHPNGRLYWCHGRKDFAVPDPDDGTILHEGKGARIWTSTIGGGEVEPFAGGGMDNPVEIDFTERGEILGSVNLFYGRPRGDTLVHWVHGGAYPRFDQPEALLGLPRTGPLLREIHDFGHVAVSGMARYRSGALEASWEDQWLVTHFNTARITRTKLVREGASFVAAETEDLFEIEDPNAHLTDLLEDHNGDLLAIDTGGWFRNGCPTSHVARPEALGTIYRLSRKDVRHDPVDYPDWDRLTAEAVSAFLDSDHEWLQQRAVLELAVRGHPAIPELRRLLEDSATPVRARRNAIWTLSRMKFSQAIDLIYDALVDPAPSVRQAAANAIGVTRTWQNIAANEPAEREIELERNRTISGALARIVRSDEPPVAREAAVALGRMGEFRAIGALLGRLGRAGDDETLRHALVLALIEIDDPEATRSALDSENPEVVAGVLQALEEMPSASLEVLAVLPHIDSETPRLRETAIEIARSHPMWDAALANLFYEWIESPTPVREETMSRLVPAHADSPPMKNLVTSALQGEGDSPDLALGWLVLAERLDFPPEWRKPLEAVLSAGPDSPRFELVLDILNRHEPEGFESILQEFLADESTPPLLRIRVIQALSPAGGRLSDEAFAGIVDLLETSEAPTDRIRAIQLLVHSRLTGKQRARVASLAPDLSAPELGAVMRLFRRIRTEEEAAPLAEALTETPGFEQFDPDRLRQLFRPFDEAIRARIEKRIAEAEAEESNRLARIEALLESMPEADPERGEELFAAGAGTCMVCHRVGDVGGLVGPDLGSIGRIRTSADLVESILYPSATIARDFDTIELIESGSPPVTRIGVIESETLSSVTLIDAGAQRHTIPRSRIASMTRLPQSLMPVGLEHALGPGQLQDLVAYLLEQRGDDGATAP